MRKLILLSKNMLLDGAIIFLFGPVHLIYLALRYGTEFGRGVVFVYPMFFSLILLFLINVAYTAFRISYRGGLNPVAKTRWFGGWLVLHTLLYLYLEVTMLQLPTVFYVECLLSGLVYIVSIVLLHNKLSGRLAVS